mmetsp:Transcript_29631/g.42018  ORF Transcript_29631/g.42018 Transcript_29631/m.42018 type:complete len:228 (-) Transcript_29631:2217-2900(-)
MHCCCHSVFAGIDCCSRADRNHCLSDYEEWDSPDHSLDLGNSDHLVICSFAHLDSENMCRRSTPRLLSGTIPSVQPLVNYSIHLPSSSLPWFLYLVISKMIPRIEDDRHQVNMAATPHPYTSLQQCNSHLFLVCRSTVMKLHHCMVGHKADRTADHHTIVRHIACHHRMVPLHKVLGAHNLVRIHISVADHTSMDDHMLDHTVAEKDGRTAPHLCRMGPGTLDHMGW